MSEEIRRRSEKDSDPSIFKPMVRPEMKPCPKCGRTVHGSVGGGYAAFGCGEFGFEAECECGISFYFDRASYDTPEAALIEGIAAWNERVSEATEAEESPQYRGMIEPDLQQLVTWKAFPCHKCGYEATDRSFDFCPHCGTPIVWLG